MKHAILFTLLFSAHLAAGQKSGCWGFGESPTLSDSDRIALRLYPAAKPLAWYDFSTYRFKGGCKRAVWISYAVAGILHGGREAYHAEPAVFEKRFGVSPQSFFGSEQWKRQYYGRDPENMPHKPNIWNPIRDYWHFSGTAKNWIMVGGAVTIGVSKQPFKYKVVDTLLAMAVFSASASLTYNLLR